MTDETAVLFMAYGTPRTLDEIEPYFTHIRGGRRPSEVEVRNLRARYEAIGGHTPLAEITDRQAKGAERLLLEQGRAVRAYVGMRHWHPFVGEVVDDILPAGHTRIVAVPLAPFHSAASTEGYRKAVDEAAAGKHVRVTFVEEWHEEPKLLEAWLAILREELAARPLGSDSHVLFTAHSLPRARLPPGDPYEGQLQRFASKVATALRVPSWSFAFQSVGLVGGDWLGPEVHAAVDGLAAKGVREILVAPVGFLVDNLETLYDLDVELSAYVRERKIAFRRSPVPNDHPALLEALAHVVDAAL